MNSTEITSSRPACAVRSTGPRPPVLVLGACLLLLAAPAQAAVPSFELGFQGCPAQITGRSGEVKTLEVFATLTTAGNDFIEGPQAWSLSATAEGGTIAAIAVDGIQVFTIYDEDINDEIPAVSPFSFDLGAADYKESRLAMHPTDGRKGAVSGVILGQSRKTVLQPNGTARIARITVQVPIPSGILPGSLTLKFENGFQGGGQPVKNVVNLDEVTYTPVLGSCSIPVRQLPSFALGFENCPSILNGAPGEVKTFDVFATLTTSNNIVAEGAQAWSLGVSAVNGTIKAISVEGLIVSTIFDDDIEDAVPPTNPFSFDLSASDFKESRLATRPSDGRKGAVSAIILGQSQLTVLQPNATARVARLTVEATIPAGSTTVPLTLRFEDGLLGTGSLQAVKNKVVLDEVTHAPALGSCQTVLSSRPTVAYGFVDCPSEVNGQPGELKTFDVFVTLTTSTNPGKEGAQAWSLGVVAEGATVKAISVEGIQVTTIYDEDVNDAVPPLNPYSFNLGDSAYKDSRLATLPADGMKGGVSAVIMGQDRKTVLQPNSSARIARVTVEATVPAEDSAFPVNLKFADGLVGGGRPVKNVVNIDEENFIPSFGTCSVVVSSRPSFALNFEGCPSTLTGSAGEVKTFDVFATLATSNNPLAIGVQAWSIGVFAEGGTIQAITVNGVEVSTIHDEDVSDAIPPIDPFPFDLKNSDFEDSRLATHSTDGRKGAVSAVVLGQDELTTLLPNATARIARITIAAPIPAGEQPADVVLRFEDGFKGPGQPRPIRNIANLDSINHFPSLGSCTVQLLPPASRQVPGDCTQDGELNIADPVCLLGFLFLGQFPRLPCGDGTVSDPGNLRLLNANDDIAGIDITDAVYAINFLFLGGPPHFMGTQCQGMGGCPSACN